MQRRQFLCKVSGATLAMPIMSFAGCKAWVPPALSMDVNNPEDLHIMHRKLVYTMDDRLVYWNIDATRMGFKDGILTPFWRVHAGIIYKLRTMAPFRYEVQALLKVFYTDLETGELLQIFDNPYTGQKHNVVQPGLFHSKRIFGLRGVEKVERKRDPSEPPAGRIYTNDAIGPAWVNGDDVWLNADSIRRENVPNHYGHLLQINDWNTYHGSLAELSNPHITSASATHNFNDINTFNSPWMGMRNVENAWSISRGFGRKSHSVSDMPEKWKALVAQTNPELLTYTPGFEV